MEPGGLRGRRDRGNVVRVDEYIRSDEYDEFLGDDEHVRIDKHVGVDEYGVDRHGRVRRQFRKRKFDLVDRRGNRHRNVQIVDRYSEQHIDDGDDRRIDRNVFRRVGEYAHEHPDEYGVRDRDDGSVDPYRRGDRIGVGERVRDGHKNRN